MGWIQCRVRRSRALSPRADGRSLRRERGAALVEMAIVTPLLLMLLVGIWTTARAWNVHNVLDHAAREAARYGATVDPWDGSSPAAVRAIADAELSASAVPVGSVESCIEAVKTGEAVTCAPPATTNTTDVDQVYVRLRYPDFPLDFVFWSTTVDLESTALARYESALP